MNGIRVDNVKFNCNRRCIIILVIFFIVFGSFICIYAVNSKNKESVYPQSLSTTETTNPILNPDQGFYYPIVIALRNDTVDNKTSYIKNDIQTYHLRMDISAYSKAAGGTDCLLNDFALNSLDRIINDFLYKGKSVIIRFAYDPNFDGKEGDIEPPISLIQSHIQQIAPILEKHKETVTAIEAGMIGKWGEMHSTSSATPECINKVISAFLSSTSTIPILVRTPVMIYNYLGITINDIDTTKIAKNTPEYRLGMFDDGFLGSESDLGTYTDRTKEISWLSLQTNHTPFGGEVVVPDSTLHNIEVCIPEMFKIHLSYLNSLWNDKVIKKWKSTYYTSSCSYGIEEEYYGKTAYTYIQNRMGYRLLLAKSTFKYPSKINKITFDLIIINLGFGSFYRPKRMSVLFVDTQSKKVKEYQVSDYQGEYQLQFTVKDKGSVVSSSSDVYLKLYSLSYQGNPVYPVQFANEGIYDKSLQANKIGEIRIESKKR